MAVDLQDVLMTDGCTVKAAILNPEDTTKPLLLTCHGAPGLSTHGEPALSYGPFQDIFRVLVSDLRGCGSSSQQGPFTHQQWIQDLDELRQWAGVDKVTFIGASHGGFLGLEYALTYPHRVEALLIGDTAAQVAHHCLLQAFQQAMTDSRVRDHVDSQQLVRLFSGTLRDMDDFGSAFASISPLYAVPPELKALAETDVDTVLPTIVSPHLETMNAAMGDCLSRYDVRDRLHELRMPVFVWVGRFDWITPVVQAEYLKEHIQGSDLVIYEKSGHLAALEEKTKFRSDVRDFLKRLGIGQA